MAGNPLKEEARDNNEGGGQNQKVGGVGENASKTFNIPTKGEWGQCLNGMRKKNVPAAKRFSLPRPVAKGSRGDNRSIRGEKRGVTIQKY